MKQVIVVRNDLKLPKGKLAAQVGHAAVEAMIKSSPNKVDEWRSEGMKKVVVKVDSVEELKEIQAKARSKKIISAVIQDAGLTVVPPGTITCLGLGPDEEDKINSVAGHLKML